MATVRAGREVEPSPAGAEEAALVGEAQQEMATPRHYKDPDYMKRVAEDLYGGTLRGSPELVQKHLRHVRWSSDYGYYLQLIAGVGWSSLPWLPFLPQSTLVMAGTDDPIGPIANGRILARLIPHACLVTIDDGHLFFGHQSRRVRGHHRKILELKDRPRFLQR